jgi:sialate O-acetylesterase
MLKLRNTFLGLLVLSMPLHGKITMAPLFQDGAVLQRDKPLVVWGMGEPMTSVSVSFAGQTKSTTTNASGKWQVSLGALSASTENRTMSITEKGSPAVEVKELWVGEVWLASGQSNMQYVVTQTVAEDQAEVAKGPVPLMRIFQVPRTLNLTRQETLEGSWTAATPETAKGFSAVAYLFGKKLTEELKVPVGMIHSSWGGSKIEPWWAEEGLVGIDELNDVRAQRLAKSPGFPEHDQPFRRFVSDMRDWSNLTMKALDSGLKITPMPVAPELLAMGHNKESGTYQAMIHPLVPYALRGFLWYQGESNNGDGMLYAAKMKALIAGWRHQFQNEDAPFLFVQIAPYNYPETRARGQDLPELWAAQQKTLEIPHTGMAGTQDIATIKDIHPPNKGEVARRLARWALADTYGQNDLVKSGPLYAGYDVTPAGIVIHFSNLGSGLATRDGKGATLFEIAGIDAAYQPAQVEIAPDGKSLLLSSPAVLKPDRARFAWAQLAEPNLINREGLPAVAFHTHWPKDPTLMKNAAAGKSLESSDPNPNQSWNAGLTDGVWGSKAGTCFATGSSMSFPKSVTVDLSATQSIHAIAYGTPEIGSTKTVAISVSVDGKEFVEVGRTDFPFKKANREFVRFEPKSVRFVRATFVGSYAERNGFEPSFGFLSELEAYSN